VVAECAPVDSQYDIMIVNPCGADLHARAP
jgi:hypothetical protein